MSRAAALYGRLRRLATNRDLRVAALALAASLTGLVLALAQQGGLYVTASSGSPAPYPAAINDLIACPLSATASNLPSPPYPCTLNPPTWSWTVVGVQYSPDGTNWSSSPGGDAEWIVQPSSSDPTATLYSTFTDNDNDGGYWNIACLASVTYTDNCGDFWTAFATTTPQEEVLTISILRQVDGGGGGYQPIKDANKNVNALIGQYIDLQAQVKPAGTPGKYQWAMPPGVTFTSYTFDSNTATLTPLAAGDLTKQMLQFYWTDAGDNRAVSCTFTPNAGKAVTNPATSLNIKAPNLSSFTSTIGTPGLLKDGGGTEWFGLFDADGAGTGEPGIRFAATVDSIKADWGAEGQWKYQQRIYIDATSEDPFGGTYTYKYKNSDGKWVPSTVFLLDTDNTLGVPYAGPFATGSGQQKASDSPQDPLDPTTTAEIAVNMEKFEMYVMFQPPPTAGKSAWVPMQVINWYYKGTVSWDGAKWDLANLGQKTDPKGNPTTTHPTWPANFKQAKWIAD